MTNSSAILKKLQITDFQSFYIFRGKMNPTELYFIFMVIGAILISIETLLPGGILGIFGALSLTASAVIGWTHFEAPLNFISVLGILIISALLVILWLKILPKTGISLSEDGRDFKANDLNNDIDIGLICETLSPLRPCGFATFNGKKIDVVSDGEWIDENQKVKVTKVDGNKIYVTQI